MKTQTQHAVFMKISRSKARDSYGYLRLTLSTPKGKFTTCGGGYDMAGELLGKYLATMLTDEQKQLAVDAKIYGITLYNGSYIIQGSCGVDCMMEIAQVAGWDITPLRDYTDKGIPAETIGYLFTPN